MAFLNSALSSLISGKDEFCCICYQNVTENAIHIQAEIIIDESPMLLSEVFNTIFNKQVINTMFNPGEVCKLCQISAINSYRFIQTCIETSTALINCIESITGSFENTIEDTDFETLFLSLNTNDFTCKHYYDEKQTLDSKASLKMFRKLLKAKPKIHSDARETKMKYNSPRKSAQFSNTRIDNDVPAIPNSDFVVYCEQDYKCKICNKSFCNEIKVRRHYFRFHCPRNVKCLICHRRFISKEIMLQHHERCHSNISCSQCGNHFKSKYVLRRHVKNHNVQITCEKCSRIYRSPEAFNKHIADDVCGQKMKKTAEQGIYFCDYCNKKYCTKAYLARHIKFEHGNAKGYPCTFCGKVFYTPSGLQVHTYKHTREKRFDCKECGSMFVTKTSLLYHTRLHTGEKPYQCAHCELRFVSASRRLDHTRRYHCAPQLECTICNTMFKTTGSLLKHKKRHFNPNSRLNALIAVCSVKDNSI